MNQIETKFKWQEKQSEDLILRPAGIWDTSNLCVMGRCSSLLFMCRAKRERGDYCKAKAKGFPYGKREREIPSLVT